MNQPRDRKTQQFGEKVPEAADVVLRPAPAEVLYGRSEWDDSGWDDDDDYDRPHVAPARQVDPPNAGVHPVYGGLNWGIKRSAHWGDWSVNHGHWGSHQVRPDGVHFDGSLIPLGPEMVRWSCDQGNEADAATVWKNSDMINTALIGRGRGPRSEAIRLRVEIGDEQLTITSYDWPGSMEPLVVDRVDV